MLQLKVTLPLKDEGEGLVMLTLKDKERGFAAFLKVTFSLKDNGEGVFI